MGSKGSIFCRRANSCPGVRELVGLEEICTVNLRVALSGRQADMAEQLLDRRRRRHSGRSKSPARVVTQAGPAASWEARVIVEDSQRDSPMSRRRFCCGFDADQWRLKEESPGVSVGAE
jgi:hypothetical protein